MCDTQNIMVHWICWISASFSSLHQFLNNYTSQVIQSWPLFIVIIIWTVKQIHHIFWEVIKKNQLADMQTRGCFTHQRSFLSDCWYLPHSDCWYLPHSDYWYLPHSDLIFTSQWLDIYFMVTVDIYLSIGWFFFRVYLHSQSFYVKSVVYPYMLHSLFLNMVLISDCWFGRRNFTTERRFDPGKNRS
jgi:hypothetical protein